MTRTALNAQMVHNKEGIIKSRSKTLLNQIKNHINSLSRKTSNTIHRDKLIVEQKGVVNRITEMED